MARPSTRARCSFAQNRVMGTNSTKPRIVYTDPFYIRPIKVHARERVMGVLLLSVYLAFDCFRIRRSSGFRFFSRVGRACWVLQGECESVPLGATARSEDPPPAHTGFGSRRPPARTKRTKSFHCRCVVCACSAGAVGSFSYKPLSPKKPVSGCVENGSRLFRHSPPPSNRCPRYTSAPL